MSKVYVLGAGFPVEGALPTLAQFFAGVREQKGKTDGCEEKKAFEETLKLEKDKCGKEYDMESAFSAIWSEDLERFGFAEEDRQRLIAKFLYTVCRTFHLCWTGGGRDKSRCLYRSFLERVREEQATLITFNYDLILDNLLFGMRLLPHYGFDLVECNTINFCKRAELGERGVTLLKMHGSQNWFRCPSCEMRNESCEMRNESCKKTHEFAKIDFCDTWMSAAGQDSSSGERCLSCHKQNMNYHIVPPLCGKGPPKKGFLKDVREKAKSEIQEANGIVFIGYSFPQSDTNIQEEFKCWVKKNCSLGSVTVVDPRANCGDFNEPFDKIFGDRAGCSCRLSYCPETFKSWFL